MKTLINKKNYLKNQEGFTLIEIIAVIVILGIMAAVAVPKFFSMQDDAAKAVMQGALSEGAVRFNHAYAKYILAHQMPPSDVAGILNIDIYLGTNATDSTTCVGDDFDTCTNGELIGDFRIAWVKDSNDLVITVLGCRTVSSTALTALRAENIDNVTKTLTGIDWGTPAP